MGRASSMDITLPDIAIGGIGSALGALGTLIVGMAIHFREMRRINNDGNLSSAQADKLEAEAMNIHFERFQREIARLEKRVITLEDEVRNCHREREKTRMELQQVRLALIENANAKAGGQNAGSTTGGAASGT